MRGADWKLVCFDLDDTLIREVHSVMLPCILNGKEKEHAVVQRREDSGEIDYITADYQRAELMKGLEESRIAASFLQLARPLKHIRQVVERLHALGMKGIVVTVGPRQVAEVVRELWGFDACYGSGYEVVDGVFTGRIRSYITCEEKITCVKDYCEKNGIPPQQCVAVGDGATDIPLFGYCGGSIALNAQPEVKAQAAHWVDTDDLMDILSCIAPGYEDKRGGRT